MHRDLKPENLLLDAQVGNLCGSMKRPCIQPNCRRRSSSRIASSSSGAIYSTLPQCEAQAAIAGAEVPCSMPCGSSFQQ
jgi:serine/threonine protein kinase